MSLSAQYTFILILYFAGLLFLGFWFNRKIKTRKDYFIAKGKLGPATIGFSFSATQMSGSSYMGAVGTEKVLGYNFAPAGVSSAATPWFSYILLGNRLRRIASRMRCVTIADVFEALTAADRPYKKAKTLSEALKIMSFMRKDQHIDPVLFDLLLTSGIFSDYAKRFLRKEQIDEFDISQFMSKAA